jgi:hypothetical protein
MFLPSPKQDLFPQATWYIPHPILTAKYGSCVSQFTELSSQLQQREGGGGHVSMTLMYYGQIGAF